MFKRDKILQWADMAIYWEIIIIPFVASFSSASVDIFIGLLIFTFLIKKFTGKNKIDIDTIRAPSWGINAVSPGAKNIYPVEIESIKLKSNQRVYGTDTEHILQFFKEAQIDGLISNPYFFNDIIMIDFKNKLFGIKR